MEKQEETRNFESGSEDQQEVEPAKQIKEENVLQFLDSVDGYLTLLDSLSSTLRQGWLELASARHSMGATRISSALFDLKVHSAATSLQVSQCDVDYSVETQPHFNLRKWASSDNGEAKPREDKLQDGQKQLRNRNNSQLSEEKASEKNGTTLSHEDQVQRQRSKSLSVFGGLVSPRLRTAQFSFETALETLVEIANTRSTMISTFDQIQKELQGING